MTKPSEYILELTLAEIVALYLSICGNGVHKGLNGYEKAVGEKVMLQPYNLAKPVRQKIAHCRFLLKEFVEVIDKDARERITHEVMGQPAIGKEGDSDYQPAAPDLDATFVPENDEARQSRWANLYAKESKIKHEVRGLHVFANADIFPDDRTNPIPNDVEVGLYPIIEGSPWRVAHQKPDAPEAVGGESADK